MSTEALGPDGNEALGQLEADLNADRSFSRRTRVVGAAVTRRPPTWRALGWMALLLAAAMMLFAVWSSVGTGWILAVSVVLFFLAPVPVVRGAAHHREK